MMRSLPSLRVPFLLAVTIVLSPSLTLPALAQDAKPAAAVESNPAPTPSALTSAILKRLQDKRLDATSDERRAAVAFYEKAHPNGVFASVGGLTPKGLSILNELTASDAWGLPSSELGIGKAPGEGASLSDTEVADLEVRVVMAALKYARFARGGRIHDPATLLASTLDRKPQLIAPAIVLETLAKAEAVDAALAGMNPQHAGFLGLKGLLAKSRATVAGDPKERELELGASVRPGQRNKQVSAVRRWLKVPATEVEGKPSDSDLYDAPLVDAVKAFQKAQGLEPADGILGNKTRLALNGTLPPSEQAILANMELWRWMPADLGETHIIVNIPEFAMRMVKEGGVIHQERIVTGLPTNQTPIFSETMKTVVMQPYWFLPESIKVNEALPSLAGDSDMFWRNGLRIRRGDREVEPNSVNWSAADLRQYTFYQPPGDANVLGKVKFLFPNKHIVYMHDTNSKALFDKAERAFSHGCMRVRNPVKLAELVLLHDKGWSADRVNQLIENGPEDNNIALDKPIPVHVSYFTVAVDGAGGVKTFRDVYGHEKRVRLALDGKWGEIEIPPDHLVPVDDTQVRQRVAATERRRSYENESRRPSNSGGNEFERALKNIFGGF
jgi:L,D-transpeptidase YcbB